jgi:hypothetical protein
VVASLRHSAVNDVVAEAEVLQGRESYAPTSEGPRMRALAAFGISFV